MKKFDYTFREGLPGGANEVKGRVKGSVSKTGYKRNSPDVHNDFNVIPSPYITMVGVDFPVYGEDNLGNGQIMYPGNDYKFPGDFVTETPMYGDGGLTQWFAEEWVDIKTGKKCGRSGKDKNGRPYPACRPSKRVNSSTPKTVSELSAAEKAEFKRKKTSGKRIDYNHERAQEGIEVEPEGYTNIYGDYITPGDTLYSGPMDPAMLDFQKRLINQNSGGRLQGQYRIRLEPDRAGDKMHIIYTPYGYDLPVPPEPVGVQAVDLLKEQGEKLSNFAKGIKFNSPFKKQESGENEDAMIGMMKARIALENEFGNNSAIQRLIVAPDNPYDFGDGNTGTHYMGSYGEYAIPDIQDVNGQLEMTGPRMNEAIRFDRDEDAEYFANENYKKVAPAFKKQEGGSLPKAQTGKETDDVITAAFPDGYTDRHGRFVAPGDTLYQGPMDYSRIGREQDRAWKNSMQFKGDVKTYIDDDGNEVTVKDGYGSYPIQKAEFATYQNGDKGYLIYEPIGYERPVKETPASNFMSNWKSKAGQLKDKTSDLLNRFQEGGEYKVKAGDTFYGIANRQGVDKDALVNANPNLDIDNLKVGQSINLPGMNPNYVLTNKGLVSMSPEAYSKVPDIYKAQSFIDDALAKIQPKQSDYLDNDNTLKYLTKSRGNTADFWTNTADTIAYHESAHTMNPKMKQFDGGPARGMFQFEGPAFQTFKNRYTNVANALNLKPDPEILNAKSADELPANKQYTAFLVNLIESDAVLKDYADGKISIEDLWLSGHKNKEAEGDRKSFRVSADKAKVKGITGGYKDVKKQGGETLYDYVKESGYSPTFANRKKIFADYFEDEYTGTAKQNIELLKKLKSGKLNIN
jgi:LysM repeat protein